MLSKKKRRVFAEGRRRAMSFWGRMAQLKGQKTEEQFFRAWDEQYRKRAYEQVIESVRPGNDYEDKVLKADAVLHTKLENRPVIRVQIKSSLVRAHDFIQKDYPVPVVWITPWDSARDIRRKTIYSIVNMFPFLAEQLKKLGCEPPVEKVNHYRVAGSFQ